MYWLSGYMSYNSNGRTGRRALPAMAHLCARCRQPGKAYWVRLRPDGRLRYFRCPTCLDTWRQLDIRVPRREQVNRRKPQDTPPEAYIMAEIARMNREAEAKLRAEADRIAADLGIVPAAEELD